jgi:antitoxin HicB
MIAYKVKLEPDDNGTLMVTAPDLPGLVTYGDDRADALAHAVDAVEEWIAAAIAAGEAVPRPAHSASKDARERAGAARLKRNEALVRLPAMSALKTELFWALAEAGITRAELMRRLKWNRESVDRLFRLDHASRLDQVEAAFRALGRRVEVSIERAA